MAPLRSWLVFSPGALWVSVGLLIQPREKILGWTINKGNEENWWAWGITTCVQAQWPWEINVSRALGPHHGFLKPLDPLWFWWVSCESSFNALPWDTYTGTILVSRNSTCCILQIAIEHLRKEGEKAWPLMEISSHLCSALFHSHFFPTPHPAPLSTLPSSGNWGGKTRWKIRTGVTLSGLAIKVHVFCQHLTCIASQIKWLEVIRSLHVALLHDFWGLFSSFNSHIQRTGQSTVFVEKKLSHYTSRWKTKELTLIKYGYMQMAEKTLYEGHKMSSQKWYTSHSAVNY